MEEEIDFNLALLKTEIEKFTDIIDQNIGVEIGEHSSAFIDTNDLVVGVYATLYRKNIVDLAHERYYKQNSFDYKNFGLKYETFIILHEIGHLQTVPTIKEYKQYNKAQKKINKSRLNDLEKLIAYWKLPIENSADKWALNYIQKFPKLVKDLDTRIYMIKNTLLSLLT